MEIARQLGVQLIARSAWQCWRHFVASPRAALFVSPSARLARVPWSALAMPGDDGFRLIELVDVLMAAPPNIVNAPAYASTRRPGRPDRRCWCSIRGCPANGPTRALGSVLGRPSPDTPLARHFGDLMQRRTVLPGAATAVDLFRRTDASRAWLAGQLALAPSRLLYVGHATAADGDVGHADRAAIHLADERPLTASDLMSASWRFRPGSRFWRARRAGTISSTRRRDWWPR